jgi:PD-(D/E)XK endonuclease
MDRPVRHKREGHRLINRRQQGDLGEASAIDWLTRHGATVWIPLGHSPDADLIAEADGRLLRVQVKTSTMRRPTPKGHERWDVALATNGGNQSWSGIAKTFDRSRFDLLFVLTGDGRRWLIPAEAIESTHGMNLGGPKYSEFEIEPSHPIESVVYGDGQPVGAAAPRITTGRGSADVGESGETVNLVPRAEWVRIPPPPSARPAETDLTTPRSIGQTRISSHHQITIPSGPFRTGGFASGDRLRIRVTGPGEATIKRIEPSGQLGLPETPYAQ